MRFLRGKGVRPIIILSALEVIVIPLVFRPKVDTISIAVWYTGGS